MFERKPKGFSDTKSGTGKRRSVAMGGWVPLTRIASSSVMRLPGPSFACDVARSLQCVSLPLIVRLAAI